MAIALSGKKRQDVDMTHGGIFRHLLNFAIPLLLGNIFQQLYNTVDSIVVGQYVGDNALAAVGSAMPILNLLLVLFIGISAGVNIMVSQYFGAKNREGLSYTVGNCITVTAIACLALMCVCARCKSRARIGSPTRTLSTMSPSRANSTAPLSLQTISPILLPTCAIGIWRLEMPMSM